MKTTWNTAEAVAICRSIEAIAPEHGCHVALTGGCLYKQGERKDLDLVFYRIRQAERIDYEGLFKSLQNLGIEVNTNRTGPWIAKAQQGDRNIDLLFPEEEGGEYPGSDDISHEEPADFDPRFW